MESTGGEPRQNDGGSPLQLQIDECLVCFQRRFGLRRESDINQSLHVINTHRIYGKNMLFYVCFENGTPATGRGVLN
ncbi:hypothetical protein Hanom_Chr07g00593671 [Helianthus anomalus]